MTDTRGVITIEDARIFWLNFEGRATEYNDDGVRNFHVELPEDLARTLEEDGWNVKWPKPKDEDAGRGPHLKVAVRYGKFRPPEVYTITSRGRTLMDEETVGVLDWADIRSVDLQIRPSRWTVGAKSGLKAYLAVLYATLNENPLDLKYADIPDAGRASKEEEPF